MPFTVHFPHCISRRILQSLKKITSRIDLVKLCYNGSAACLYQVDGRPETLLESPVPCFYRGVKITLAAWLLEYCITFFSCPGHRRFVLGLVPRFQYASVAPWGISGQHRRSQRSWVLLDISKASLPGRCPTCESTFILLLIFAILWQRSTPRSVTPVDLLDTKNDTHTTQAP